MLRRCLLKHLRPIFGAALFSEYEDLLALDGLFSDCSIDKSERQDLFEALIAVSSWKHIFYGWRPNLRDEADNHIVELAVAGSAGGIITHNLKDFTGLELQFPSLEILTPVQLLQKS